MRFRVATLNLEQDHKRWDARRHLIGEEIANLCPDILALNEVSVPLHSARSLRKSAAEVTGLQYNLVQQTHTNSLSKTEGEALLTRFPVLETGNLDEFARLMDVHWQRKKERSQGMSNADINAWYDCAMANGALGGKVIGAGGGGFLMFYAGDKVKLRHAMREKGLTEVRFRFDFEGTQLLNQ